MTSQMEDLLVLGIGVSENKTDGVLRFEHFCKIFDLPYRILGDGKMWRGGEMAAGMGGGQKINEVIEALESLDNRLVIICDTFDLFPIAGKIEIMDKYNKLCQSKNTHKFNRQNELSLEKKHAENLEKHDGKSQANVTLPIKNQIIFSSEVFCWPDKRLADSYPAILSKYKYLNSGCIMGYRDEIYNLIKNGNIKDNDDDQLFFTVKYLSGGEDIVLDHKCELFQAINGAYDDVILHKNRVYNKYTHSYPIFLHGNGPAKIFLNKLENYIDDTGLNASTNYSYTLEKHKLLDTLPKVFFALYIDSSKTIEYMMFFRSVCGIDYQNKIIYVYDVSNNEETKQIMETLNFHYFANINNYVYDDFFKESDCQYYFLLEQRCIITEKNILHELIPLCNGYHRIISPLLIHKENKLFTNYWGDIDNKGYYRRSDDYLSLINYDLRGLWNAPYVSGAILFHGSIIKNWNLSKTSQFTDNDMNLCCNLRKDTLFMYMCNLSTYGYLD